MRSPLSQVARSARALLGRWGFCGESSALERGGDVQCAWFWEIDERDVDVVEESNSHWGDKIVRGMYEALNKAHTAYTILIGRLDFCEDDLGAKWAEDGQAKDDCTRRGVVGSWLSM